MPLQLHYLPVQALPVRAAAERRLQRWLDWDSRTWSTGGKIIILMTKQLNAPSHPALEWSGKLPESADTWSIWMCSGTLAVHEWRSQTMHWRPHSIAGLFDYTINGKPLARILKQDYKNEQSWISASPLCIAAWPKSWHSLSSAPDYKQLIVTLSHP